MNLSGDTFYRDNGGVYVDTLGTLNIINSTFLGSTNAPEGIDIASGIGNITFSTILLADLSGSMSGFNLSNSLLRAIDCTNVTDDGNNLSNQSPTCSSIPNEADLGLSPQFLQNNGGPTPTIALVTGSPAIGAIKIGDCLDLSGNPLTIDQRGFGRPSPTNPGFCDTGAYEFGAVAAGTGIGGIPPGTTF